ncbi:DUF4838 domain-containing protein [Paenibacillus sp. 481]|uniref:DUF4838 domain-containing protein n=1 Tax=Paenibacillus sp. 481 TaxID=2835869 RepID=UPI001E396539|nr:DUF4838 domain-containing protein [Paenibacillus sp. 481]UHA72472.1 DUF4838 domain-containing protein [Paenibacillus sp. 481]
MSSLLLFTSVPFVEASEHGVVSGERFLVRDGQSESVIIWWSGGGDEVPAFAAAELQSYAGKITGAQVPIRKAQLSYASGSGQSLNAISSGIAIVTGAEALTFLQTPAGNVVSIPAEWFVQVNAALTNAKEDSFSIQTLGSKAILAGTNDRGTLYSSYELIERLGVQFFAPNFDFYNGNSEFVPTQSSIAVADLNVKEEPSLKYRRKYVEEGWSHTSGNLPQLIDWMAKNKLNILAYPTDYIHLGIVKYDTWRSQLVPELKKRGIVLEAGGHGFDSFLQPSKYKAQHPEWFVAGYNVFDVANDAAVAAYINEVVDYLRQRPEIRIFDAWPPDNATWPPSAAQRYGSIANAYAAVVNKLDDAVQAQLPGVRIEAIAYQSHIDPPSPAYAFKPTILIDFAPIDRSHAEPINGSTYPANTNYVNLINKWRAAFTGDLAMYEYYRRYSFHSLPIVMPTLIGQELPYYHSLGISGLGIYSEPGDWLTYEITHLIAAQKSWDTTLDTQSFVDEYVKARFGQASAADVAAYLVLVENTGRQLFDRFRGNYGDLNVITSTRANYVQARTNLTQAAAKTPANSSSAFILQRLLWNIDYAIADTEVSYYSLQRNSGKLLQAKQATKGYVETHKFNGIITQSLWALNRYQGNATRENTLWIYDLYRNH